MPHDPTCLALRTTTPRASRRGSTSLGRELDLPSLRQSSVLRDEGAVDHRWWIGGLAVATLATVAAAFVLRPLPTGAAPATAIEHLTGAQVAGGAPAPEPAALAHAVAANSSERPRRVAEPEPTPAPEVVAPAAQPVVTPPEAPPLAPEVASPKPTAAPASAPQPKPKPTATTPTRRAPAPQPEPEEVEAPLSRLPAPEAGAPTDPVEPTAEAGPAPIPDQARPAEPEIEPDVAVDEESAWSAPDADSPATAG